MASSRDPAPSPVATAPKGERTRFRILFTAERLFAEHGIEAVSLRTIASLANHRNNNAVQYYFGTKEKLVAAIFEHRVAQMDPPRGDMLAKAEAAGLLSDAMTLMRILCLPHLRLVDERGKYPYAGFMSQYLTRYRPTGMLHAADHDLATTANLRRLLDLMEQRISYVPASARLSRIALCNLMFVNLLVRRDHAPQGADDLIHFDEHVADTLEIATQALCAPYRHSRAETIG